MRKIRLPQPYAQMVACGALKSIPNVFDDIKKLEKVYIFADDFEDKYRSGLDFDNELHQRIWNEMTLGNIPDKTYSYNCFIGYVIVSAEEESEDNWMANCDKYLKTKVAKEFKEYIDNFECPDSILQEAKTKAKVLQRMVRNGDSLIVPVGKDTWDALKYRETIDSVFLFWEPYMSEISPFLFSKEFMEFESEDIVDIIFKYRNLTKRFEADCAGSNVRSCKVVVDKSGKTKVKSYFTFDFNLENIIKGGCYEEIPYKPQKKHIEKSSDEDIEENTSVREFRNPWPRFISTPMGGMNKWRKR